MPAAPVAAVRTVSPAKPAVPARPALVVRLLSLPRWQLGVLVGAPVVLLAAVGTVVLSLSSRSKTALASYPVTIVASPADATITVDGRTMGASPFSLTAGPHSIEVAREGYVPQSRPLTVRQGLAPETFRLEPALQQLRVVTALPAGQVILDGKAAGSLNRGEFRTDDLPAAEHSLQVKDGARDALEVRFRSGVAALAEVLPPLKTQNLVVVSSLGSRIRVYVGPGSTKVGLKDQPFRPVPPEGLPFSGVTPGTQLITSDGKSSRSLPIVSGSAPSLSIYAADVTQVLPLLSIVSNVTDPKIIIGGRVYSWPFDHSGRAAGRLNPGKYAVRLEKPSYAPEEQTVDLTGGDATVKFHLNPVPQVAALVIEDSTPGAEVLIDGVSKGTIKENGEFETGEITPGEHDVTIRKPLFDQKDLKKRVFVVGQTLRLSGADAKLQPFGAIRLKVLPPDADLSYRRETETDYNSIQNDHDTPLSAGRYRIKATAAGHLAHEEPATIESAKMATVTFSLVRMQAKAEPAKPSAPAPSGLFGAGWNQGTDGNWEYTGPGYGPLRVSNGNFIVTVQKKHGGFVGGGSVEWVVGYANNGKDRVTYHLGKDGSLRRQPTIDGRTGPEAKAKKRVSGSDIYKFQVIIEPHRIVVSNDAGEVMDEYADTSSDFTKGQFGFRSGIRLSISH